MRLKMILIIILKRIIRDFNYMYSLVDFSYINFSGRMDAEFYRNNVNKNIIFVKLKDLCEFIETGPSGSVLRADNYISDGVSIVRPSNLDGWKCDNGRFVFADIKNIVKNKIKFYKKEDILIGRIGDFKCGIIDRGKCLISSNLLVIRVNKKLCNPYFLLAYLNSEKAKKQIENIVKKVSLSSININNFSEIEIPILSIKEQNIVGKRVKKALKLLRESKNDYNRAERILRGLISSVDGEAGIIKNFCDFSILKKAKRMDAEFFVNDSYNILQKLKYLLLHKISEISRGIEPGRDMYTKNGILFLRPSNISKFGIDDKSQKFVSEKYYKKISDKYQPRRNEVLLVKDGKIGVACKMTNFVKAIISSGVVRINVNEEFDPSYIAMCLNSEFCIRQMVRQSGGSLVPHLNIDSINNIKIPLADAKTQKIISQLAGDSFYKFNRAVEILRKNAESFSISKMSSS